MRDIGSMYYEGKGVIKDYKKQCNVIKSITDR